MVSSSPWQKISSTIPALMGQFSGHGRFSPENHLLLLLAQTVSVAIDICPGCIKDCPETALFVKRGVRFPRVRVKLPEELPVECHQLFCCTTGTKPSHSESGTFGMCGFTPQLKQLSLLDFNLFLIIETCPMGLIIGTRFL